MLEPKAPHDVYQGLKDQKHAARAVSAGKTEGPTGPIITLSFALTSGPISLTYTKCFSLIRRQALSGS